MTQIDELKKWLNECFRHYEVLLEMKSLTPYDRTIWDAYRSVMSRIGEIEGNEASKISSNAVLKVTSDSKKNKKESEMAVCIYCKSADIGKVKEMMKCYTCGYMW